MQDLSLCSASLLPKLRDQYAEFLDHVSLVHLRLLASPTCVGFRYGHRVAPLTAFLACRLYHARAWGCPRALAIPSRTLLRELYAVRRPSTWPPRLRSSVPVSFITTRRGRNVNRLSIAYASGPSPYVPPHP